MWLYERAWFLESSNAGMYVNLGFFRTIMKLAEYSSNHVVLFYIACRDFTVIHDSDLLLSIRKVG